MARWRDTKKGKLSFDEKEKESTNEDSPTSIAPIPNRIKAFIVDMFMIMMPIMYITTYLIMEGKDDFQGSSEARWITALVYGLVTIIFWVFKGQTPGYKAYDLKLVNENGSEKVGIIKATFRYLIFIFSCVTILLALLPFFRKDKKTIQDILTKTVVIKEK